MLIVPRGIVDVIGLVRCVVAEEEEEGIVFVAMDEGDGIIGGDLGIMTYVGIVP